jgi:hypothetical protein
VLVVDEVETDVLRVVAVEVVAVEEEVGGDVDDEVNFEVVELELETTTGLRLLYIDNRFAPPHCDN